MTVEQADQIFLLLFSASMIGLFAVGFIAGMHR